VSAATSRRKEACLHHRRVPHGAGRRLVLLALRRAARARSHLQRSADGLDAELVAVGVDERRRHLCGRSSAAAKEADARRKISLARRVASVI
jgi:hypothetical protein